MIHRIAFRAFVAATEDEDRVRRALSILVPLESISATVAEGHFGNKIKILEAHQKKKEGKSFFRLLREQMPAEDLSRLKRELSDRIDEGCNLHLRLDKQAAYQGMLRLTDSRDAIDVSVLLESYPARQEEAIRIAGELL